MISEKEIWKSIYKFCKINLTVFDNLSLVFKSLFNLLLFKNKESIMKTSTFNSFIFLENLSILMNNLSMEFILHIKEFIDSLNPTLVNYKFLS